MASKKKNNFDFIVFIVVLFLSSNICTSGISFRELLSQNETSTSSERLYFMKRLGGAGCPYMASWFIHINHFRRVTWWIDITKMEAASFNVFDSAKLKFQLSDPDAYFVHHMSMYEHFNHKKFGFEVAKNKTLIMSRAAVEGECDNVIVSKSKNIVAFVPFFGGLPPGVTKDLTVKSIGQGNSLVDASTKALQAQAAVCACLKYFGNVIIGVTRPEDKVLMIEMISSLSQTARHHVNVIQLRMAKPAHLPFHLLAWGQYYMYHHNCWPFYDKTAPALHSDGSLGFTPYPVLTYLLPNSSEYDICYPRTISKYHGGPVQVVFSLKNFTHLENPKFRSSHTLHENDVHSNMTHSSSNSNIKPRIPLKYAYYTECDQIVHFDTHETFDMFIAATNESAFFTGRRKEKIADSDPTHYMQGLNVWRECGATGYLLRWPDSNIVYPEK